MIKQLCIFLWLFVISSIAFAQEITYKENMANGYTRLFYDDNYYLVDKNCEFKYIERVAQYDSIQLKFNGEFKDFNQYGRLILHGFYKNGLKDGKFTAYHPNGKVKWESTFINDDEVGHWKYYYPDGKPMLIVSLESDDFKFIDFWNNQGEHKIVNGEGKYNINIPIKGFTDHGYTIYNLDGAIKNGKPDGMWFTSFVTEDKKKNLILLFTEIFSEGKRESVNLSNQFYGYFIPLQDFLIVPSEIFSRSELFLVSNCSFDQYSGFQNFIIRKFNYFLNRFKFDQQQLNFQYKVDYVVNKDGIPQKMTLSEKSEDVPKEVHNVMTNMFRTLTYFIPSVSEGKAISDDITFTADFSITNNKGIMKNLEIKRHKGK